MAGKPTKKNTKNSSKSNSKSNSSSKSRSQGNRTSSSGKTNTRGKQQGKRDEEFNPEVRKEISIFIYLAITIFLICSNFGACGVVGNVVSRFFFGLFGTVTHALPIYFLLFAAFMTANPGSGKLIKKFVWIGIAIVSIAFIIQLYVGVDDMTFKELYTLGHDTKNGGGAIFGGLLVLIYRLIGKVGAAIVTTVMIIVSFLFVSEMSVSKVFKNIFQSRARYYDDDDYDDEYDDEEVDDIYDDYYDNMDYSHMEPKRNLLNNVVVLDSDNDSKEPVKKKRGRPRKDGYVRDEEVHEIKPSDFMSFDDESDGKGSNMRSLYMPDENKNSHGKKEEIKGFPSRKKNSVSEDGTYYDLHPEVDTFDDLFERKKKERENREAKLARNAEYEQQSNRDVSDSPYDNAYDDVPVAKEVNKPVQGMASEPQVNKKDTEKATNDVMNMISESETEPKKEYKFPPMSLLKSGRGIKQKNNDQYLRETAIKLQKTLESFGVNVTITDFACGPAVTRYELTPEVGVKVNKITALADDIKLNLAAADIRIEAPIPGKAAVGIEVPNKENTMVYYRDLIDNDEFKNAKSNISFAVGKDIGGNVVITDIAKMPHLLVAGSTGSGKSVCINTIIMSILYKAHPDDVKFIMVDPKMVELTAYNGIPHLLIPVVTDAKKAAGALNWAVIEMTRRYQLFAECSVRNIEGYNNKVASVQNMSDVNPSQLKKMPQIVVIVDELADLMMVAHNEVEDSIVRLSQLARAAGIHLVIATQRPSVDVITGLIKANVPSRIAFAVSSGVDSRTILDMVGAEKLLGKGDMLFYPTGYTKPVRVQGAFVSDDEVVAVTDFIKNQYGESTYDSSISESIEKESSQGGSGLSADGSDDSRYDEYFEDAARLVIEKDKASIGNLQRVFRIGFNRAARIMDQLCEAGVVGPEEGTKPRRILMTMSEFDEFLDN